MCCTLTFLYTTSNVRIVPLWLWCEHFSFFRHILNNNNNNKSDRSNQIKSNCINFCESAKIFSFFPLESGIEFKKQYCPVSVCVTFSSPPVCRRLWLLIWDPFLLSNAHSTQTLIPIQFLDFLCEFWLKLIQTRRSIQVLLSLSLLHSFDELLFINFIIIIIMGNVQLKKTQTIRYGFSCSQLNPNSTTGKEGNFWVESLNLSTFVLKYPHINVNHRCCCLKF